MYSKLLINPKTCVPSAPDIPSSGNREQRENRCSNDQPFHHGRPASLPGNESALELRWNVPRFQHVPSIRFILVAGTATADPVPASQYVDESALCLQVRKLSCPQSRV